MPKTTLTPFNHPYYSGAKWTAPLRTGLEIIDQSTLNKIAKVALSCLTYIVFGVPAIIGMHLNRRSMDQVDKVCKVFKTTLQELNGVFDGTLQGHESYSIDFKSRQRTTYEQNKQIRIEMKRAPSEKEIKKLVNRIRTLSYNGLFIDRIGIATCNQYNPTLLGMGCFQRETFANITLHVPDQFHNQLAQIEIIE